MSYGSLAFYHATIPAVMKAHRMLTAVDLFSGCGGTTLGLRLAGFDVRAAVELDAKAGETYGANHPDVRLLVGDLREIPPNAILEAARLAGGECSVLVGCPPCQGFSTHRLHDSGSDDPRNDLVGVFADCVVELRPFFFVFENVPGLLRQADSPWADARAELASVGYRIVEGLVNAGDYGVPQRRKRLLAALIGLVVGFPLVLLALFFSFVLGGAVGAAAVLVRRIGMRDTLPFAPFLAVGGMVALLYGEEILRWYPGAITH